MFTVRHLSEYANSENMYILHIFWPNPMPVVAFIILHRCELSEIEGGKCIPQLCWIAIAWLVVYSVIPLKKRAVRSWNDALVVVEVSPMFAEPLLCNQTGQGDYPYGVSWSIIICFFRFSLYSASVCTFL